MLSLLFAFALLWPTSLATFGPTVDADWSGTFPYVVRLGYSPPFAKDYTSMGMVVSAKIVIIGEWALSTQITNDPKDYVLTDYTLEKRPMARIIGLASPAIFVTKVCKPFGPARFNLTQAEFFDYAANSDNAAIIFFQFNTLKSMSTQVLSDTNCNAVYPGKAPTTACIRRDTTPGICRAYLRDAWNTGTTYIHGPSLVVNNRVQGAIKLAQCSDPGLDNTKETTFYKFDAYRSAILGVDGAVVDNS
ncbi:uncharacterized protein LOC132195740 [Neocloeon triangulifer]|uniref:uncharacterized protein LOC132195740 n=1 Tax=Neocloeon triangulifer TaxID=2078957 RepID=UPI00286F3F3E|nr:uncharacterized protein LOC132195740 [Neocloeon triangulifer]